MNTSHIIGIYFLIEICLCSYPDTKIASIRTSFDVVDYDGSTISIPTRIFIPAQPTTGNRHGGCIIFLHGSGGLWKNDDPTDVINENFRRWADMSYDRGYIAIFTDSYTPRGGRSNSDSVDNRPRDVYGAMKFIKQYGIDNNIPVDKIFVVGWSDGGSSTIATMSDTTSGTNHSPNIISAAAAFYPGCGLNSNFGGISNSLYCPSAPLRIYAASEDSLCCEHCNTRMNRATEIGCTTRSEWILTIYQGADHGYDQAEATDIPPHSTKYTQADWDAHVAADAAIWEYFENIRLDNTNNPTKNPTVPSVSPTQNPTIPTSNPSQQPTDNPSYTPTNNPTDVTNYPSQSPTKLPTSLTKIPTKYPSVNPTISPTKNPTVSPTNIPTNNPTGLTKNPTKYPSVNPSVSPTKNPSLSPTTYTTNPTKGPTNIPSISPTNIPTIPSSSPSQTPTNIPTLSPTNHPTTKPTDPSCTYTDSNCCCINTDRTTTMDITQDNCVVFNCVFKGITGSYAIRVGRSTTTAPKNLLIQGNTFGDGTVVSNYIYIYSAEDATIKLNTFPAVSGSSGIGIYLIGDSNTADKIKRTNINGNIFTNLAIGIRIKGATDTIIEQNIFTNIDDEAIIGYSSSSGRNHGIDINGNRITSVKPDGSSIYPMDNAIYLKYIDGIIRIRNNIISGTNDNAIYVYKYASGAKIEGNIISNCDASAIYIRSHGIVNGNKIYNIAEKAIRCNDEYLLGANGPLIITNNLLYDIGQEVVYIDHNGVTSFEFVRIAFNTMISSIVNYDSIDINGPLDTNTYIYCNIHVSNDLQSDNSYKYYEGITLSETFEYNNYQKGYANINDIDFVSEQNNDYHILSTSNSNVRGYCSQILFTGNFKLITTDIDGNVRGGNNIDPGAYVNNPTVSPTISPTISPIATPTTTPTTSDELSGNSSSNHNHKSNGYVYIIVICVLICIFILCVVIIYYWIKKRKNNKNKGIVDTDTKENQNVSVKCANAMTPISPETPLNIDTKQTELQHINENNEEKDGTKQTSSCGNAVAKIYVE